MSIRNGKCGRSPRPPAEPIASAGGPSDALADAKFTHSSIIESSIPIPNGVVSSNEQSTRPRPS
jgi:hypothetical protein